MINNIENSQYIELWMYRYVIYRCTVLRNPVGSFNINCFLNFLCFISLRWWKLENQCSSHRLFVSWVSWILSLLQTVIHFPTTGIKWCMQFQYSMSLQDCVCGFLLDESDPVGRGLLRCCSLWYTGGHPGTVVWHLCSSHFCGCILRFQKTSEYAFFNRPIS